MTLRSLEKFVEEKSEEKDFITEISPAVQELKARLTSQRLKISCNKQFYWSWPPCIERGGAKVEPKHEEIRLRSDGQCCFVDILSRPEKNGKPMPLLPYQKLLWQMLHRHRRL